MTEPGDAEIANDIERLFRAESGRVLATLIRLLGDFDSAEEGLQDAFTAALQQWPRQGKPDNPRAWLISAGRNRAIDRLRRAARFAERESMVSSDEAERLAAQEPVVESGVDDDRLRLIFTCCHPALAPEAQVALTLRTVCGITTDEIARAFLVPAPTMAQRLVRATRKIRDARIPYRIPPPAELPARVESVCAVVYLVFTEGYAATYGGTLVRRDLCSEAIRLGRLLLELMPGLPELRGLLALMLLHDARRDARISPGGDIVLLEDQDRALWDRQEIEEGLTLVESALRSARVGAYGIQAAIAALHARAATAAATDWRQIASLYALLVERHPTPVIELNHAVAVAMTDGAEAGLLLIDALGARGELRDYHLMHSARADLLCRLGHEDEAAHAYRAARDLATGEPERRFLDCKLSQLRQRHSLPAPPGAPLSSARTR